MLVKLITFFICLPAFAVISASTQWEIRTAGNATNGGGYSTGGTDMSQFDNKNAAGCTSCQSATDNISVTNAVTNNTTTVTSVTANFTSALIGNVVYLSGSGTTTGWYQVTGVTDSATITVDRATGSTGGTGVTLNIGGALTIAALGTTYVAGNNVWVRSGTYNITANIPLTVACTNVAPCEWEGYTSTRGDGGSPTIVCNTTTCSGMLNQSGAFHVIRNFILNVNAKASSRGLFAQANSISNNIQVTNIGSSSIGIAIAFNGVRVQNFSVTGGSSGCTAGVTIANQTVISDFYIGNNGCAGISVTQGTVVNISRGVIAKNTGAGITSSLTLVMGIRSVTFHANTAAGINCGAATTCDSLSVFNCIFTNNGDYGIKSSSTTYPYAHLGFNAFYNNTNGAVLGMPTGLSDVNTGSWAALPYTNATSDDYTLANTTEGNALKQAGSGGTLPNLSGTSYLSLGAFQAQPGGGSGGGTVVH